MTITVPAELAAAATAAGIDPEAVALTAIADAVEAAAIADANEATNAARRAALDAVRAEIEPTRELVRTRAAVADGEPVRPTRRR